MPQAEKQFFDDQNEQMYRRKWACSRENFGNGKFLESPEKSSI